MQIELSAVLGFFGVVLSVTSMIVLALGRIAVANREKELDRRIDEVTKDHKATDTRLHAEEKATIRQDGEIKLVQQVHRNLARDIEDIKTYMVTKAEFNQLEKGIERLTNTVEGRPPRPNFTPSPTGYGQHRDRDRDRNLPIQGESTPPKRGT